MRSRKRPTRTGARPGLLRIHTDSDLSDMPPRPRIRADCLDGPRPCPWVGCEHNTYLDIRDGGKIWGTRPLTEPDEYPAEYSCVLDMIDNNPDGLDCYEIADALNVVYERIRQIICVAEGKLRKSINEADCQAEPDGTAQQHTS